MKPIETIYRGIRFRSRLEARWAVFLDALSLRWEYEPQGFICTHRLRLTGSGEGEQVFSYLPDFWIPDIKMWAEVKATLTDQECRRLLDAAASLSSNDGGGCHDAGGHDLIVLGALDPGYCYPIVLHMHKGDLTASPWPISDPHSKDAVTVASDAPDLHRPIYDIATILTRGARAMSKQVGPKWHDALNRARSARFEHGEIG